MANQNSINNTSYGITVLGTALINQSGSAASTIGNSSGGAVAIASGAASTIAIANQSLAITTGTGALNISNDAAATTVGIATGAGVKALTLGSTNTTSSVTINTGSGGITIPSFTTTGALVSNASGVITDANASTAGFVLTSNGAGSAPSFQANSGGSGITSINGNSGTATPSGGVVSIVGSGKLSTSGSGATLTISGGGMPWTNVTGTTQSMTVNSAYVANAGASLITFTLPSTAAIGDLVAVQGSGTGLWTIAQNSGQTIHFNAVNSTTGVTGSVSSTSRYDSLYLLCITANTDFVATQSTGNLSVV